MCAYYNSLNSNQYRTVSFQELKKNVGIEEVAYSLGYRLDRKAGIGRFFEMVLGDGKTKRDTIVIRNTPDKASQTFFRRDGSRGDVITLIKENLNSFNCTGKSEWEMITNILSKFANMPLQERKEEYNQASKVQGNQKFEPERWEIEHISKTNIHPLLRQRGLTDETILKFSPYVHLINDKHNKNFNGYNIGFPYYDGKSDKVVGYEIRGYGGFKSKAAGTNSSSGAWIADFTNGNGVMASSVFFFESAFDAMAFYQMNSARLSNDIAFVSIGGTFSNHQIRSAIKKFPNAVYIDCFDNDLAGRINGLRMMAIAESIPLHISRTEDSVYLLSGDKKSRFYEALPILPQLDKIGHTTGICGEWTAPKQFKDWNDCLLNKPISYEPVVTKHDRNENLAEQRKASSLKP